MVVLSDPTAVKVYTVNGAATGSSSSLPDWLTRKRAVKGKGKRRAIREEVEGTIDLIQHFEFPEASNKVKTTRDGHHAIATGTYKPQIRVWDLDQLSLKFERHTDAENVDFVMLSNDWTKSIHLQCDRSVELHTQGGFHYRTRLPRFGRTLAYHFPSCDALFGASGPEVFRLNLDQGRFLNPLRLVGASDDGSGTGEDVLGVNCIDINPAHQLFAFGVDGNGTVEFWDPRSRSRVGLLRLPRERLLPLSASAVPALPGVDDGPGGKSLSTTAIASRADGLSYAIGTSSGHTLLYDIRAARPVAMKDQGYGLPVKNVLWVEGGAKMGMAGEGMVLSADRKVVKIWDRHEPETNFTSITPASDINDVHHVPGSGLLLLANEGIHMTSYFIPQLGPAPKWCSFLENLTEEMEDQTARTAYKDYKFVERSELASLGLDHLIGTPALKPYMHGYFIALPLYDAARVIANPYVHAEARERAIREKVEKMAETRIRAPKNAGAQVKVNKALAEKIKREEERERKREERKKKRKAEKEQEQEAVMDVDEVVVVEEADEAKESEDKTEEEKERPNLLNDPRFKALFENTEFEVDEDSREFALLNPSAAAHRQNGTSAKDKRRTRTAVESEESASERASSDEDKSESDEESEGDSSSEDSDTKGELWQDDIRARMAARNSSCTKARVPSKQRTPNVHLVPLRARADGSSSRAVGRDATFGQRRSTLGFKANTRQPDVRRVVDGGMELTFIPSSSRSYEEDEDEEITGGRGKKSKEAKRKGVETFGAGLQRGGEPEDAQKALSENERQGRTQRRKGMRSGSKNTFRKR
ncbi:uncharacterized protein LAESUDRAFT_721606 [Laetiporus sulphureus 93-53]|uniref:Uncharacterized protein n=1 Tax=Laetiporus sulphureus 93-53 TaxID=1314785 RepID=A0A165GFC8_9APHY|nr:uncharacterized protein LAESUDRAFT_721606 [Laetiporus sulphureus 93-53]KZT10272.1 hypothetical protein LAESUDRAFT_721606 [Laetiporus sulphureus 93-53]